MDGIKKKNIILIVALCISLLFVLTILSWYYIKNTYATKIDISQFETGNNEDIVWSIESIEIDASGNLLISGYCLKPGVTYSAYNYGSDEEVSSVYNNMHIGYVLDDFVYVIPTRLCMREDVNELMGDGINYKYCGFNSRVSSKDYKILENAAMVIIWENPDGTKEIYYIQ